ncbi:MAG: hypothetical protein IKH61_12595 [Bacteroidales bacterium]|nr:hypothetical protein [Bacteroidales bacterium]
MNRLSKVISAIMIVIAVMIAAGCTKLDNPNNSGGGSNNSEGNEGGDNGGGSEHYYTISVSVFPTTASGSIVGAGTYQGGQSCTLQAIANNGYSFSKWTNAYGTQVLSTDENYTFTVNGDMDLVAFFNTNNYTISASANPSDGGSVSGGGVFYYGQICRMTASAANGYTFANWTANDTVVSTNALFHFAVERDYTLMANFIYLGVNNVLEGAINGKFTINRNGDQVYFSQGNLQYSKSTQTWSFMEHQYDRVEIANQDVGYNYENQDVVSLFGYGTSGWNSGNELFLIYCYHPWDTDNSLATEFGSTHYFHADLQGFGINADWGIYNAISNGGNQAGMWRTLTEEEWKYVFFTRSTISGIRFAKACVNNVNGVILFPDDWNSNYYSLNSANTGDSSFSSNTITVSEWETLEQHGAVFLSAAGYRYGTSVFDVNNHGYYWSSTSYGWDNNSAWGVRFCDSYLRVDTPTVFYGSSVRLVHDVD